MYYCSNYNYHYYFYYYFIFREICIHAMKILGRELQEELNDTKLLYTYGFKERWFILK